MMADSERTIDRLIRVGALAGDEEKFLIDLIRLSQFGGFSASAGPGSTRGGEPTQNPSGIESTRGANGDVAGTARSPLYIGRP